MLDVKEIFENLSDQEKEELRKLLLHHTDDVKAESPKEDTFANIAIIDPFQHNEEVKDKKKKPIKKKEVETADSWRKAGKSLGASDLLMRSLGPVRTDEESAGTAVEEVEVADLTVSEKQEFLVKFGYDPTNVKYMNTDILGQAYDSALKIRDAESGGETITAIGTGLPTEG